MARLTAVSCQVPFEFAVQQVSEQLRKIAKGDYTIPSTEKRKLGTVVFAAVDLPAAEIQGLLNKVINSFLFCPQNFPEFLQQKSE